VWETCERWGEAYKILVGETDGDGPFLRTREDGNKRDVKEIVSELDLSQVSYLRWAPER
jgi:hypothetical protein